MTTTTLPPYTLEAQLPIGAAGESEISCFFARWYVVERATKIQQSQGIDFIFTNPQSAEKWTVELKTDTKAVRNVFIETIAEQTVDAHGKPRIVKYGWAFTSRAQVLLYYVHRAGEVYVVPMPRLRGVITRYVSRFTSISVPNATYWTQGLLVPITEFARIAKTVLKLPPPPAAITGSEEQEPVQLELQLSLVVAQHE